MNYAIDLLRAHNQQLTWRDEWRALLTAYRTDMPLTDLSVDAPDEFGWLLVPNPDNPTPVLIRRVPPTPWFEAQDGTPVDAPTPSTACHPDDFRWVRTIAGLSQQELADRMRSTQAQVSHKENGQGLVTGAYWKRVLKATSSAVRSGPGAWSGPRQQILARMGSDVEDDLALA